MMAETRLIDGREGTGGTYIEFLRGNEFSNMVRISGGRIPSMNEIDESAETALARVNCGRWITDCPQIRCPGTSYVWIGGPRQFFCGVCSNRGIGGMFRLVTIPDEWEEIEAVLFERFVFTERNWNRGLSVLDLAVENLEGGYAVPQHLLSPAIEEMSRRRDIRGREEAEQMRVEPLPGVSADDLAELDRLASAFMQASAGESVEMGEAS